MPNQAAVLYAPHDIRLEAQPVPTPGPKEVLVEAVGCILEVKGASAPSFRGAPGTPVEAREGL
jgi:hypothetical protein